MVLGLRTKSKKSTSVQVNYVVHVQEIKPWPPSQSLKSLRSVVLQWENGDRNSGATDPVIPSSDDGKIEFDKSFKLHVTLFKDGHVKGNDGAFHKNVLELNLYEPRNKTIKGQHLGSATIDLAEHGIIKEAVSIGAPVSCKRSFRNTSQPVLYVKIQPFDKDGSASSSTRSLAAEVAFDKDGMESVSSLMTEEYAEEAEIASFTDDDEDLSNSLPGDSTPASEINASSPPKGPTVQLLSENASSEGDKRNGTDHLAADLRMEPASEMADGNPSIEASSPEVLNPNANKCAPSVYCEYESSEKGDSSLSDSLEKNLSLIHEIPDDHSIHSVLSTITCESLEEEIGSNTSFINDSPIHVVEKFVDCKSDTLDDCDHPSKREDRSHVILLENVSSDLGLEMGGRIINIKDCKEDQLVDEEECIAKDANPSTDANSSTTELPDELSPLSISSAENIPFNKKHNILPSSLRKPVSGSNTFSRRSLGGRSNSTFTSDRIKQMKSVRLPMTDVQFIEDVKEIDVLEDVHYGGRKFSDDKVMQDQENRSLTNNKVKHVSPNLQNGFSDDRIRELELRVEKLETELREIAAIEISLYSVVTEHGSSCHKVHAPARRLSRLYIYASRHWSPERRASAARSIVSGLVLAARACGNDVPRLTFWLSNLIVLRATITPTVEGLAIPATSNPHGVAIGTSMGTKKKYSLNWEPSSRERKFSFNEKPDDWLGQETFRDALQKIEAWLFSRIVESLWWQILTPRMLSRNDSEERTKLHSKSNCERSPRFSDHQRAIFSIDHWKKAFKEAFEKLCPVRADGHECGCLPMLARLVMEQCVARLDVAIFNAILREPEDENPTDPVSDPIGDSKVLPIPVGKLSFGAGAQLKNAIGNWSRWLTDLFGIDDECPEDDQDKDDDRLDLTASLKSFRLLNALSDLLMLPKDMLLESSVRKEVCPTFSGLMIKRILNSFSLDEFCPDPIPDNVFEALDAEDLDEDKNAITSVPYNATPITYNAPSLASIMLVTGDTRSQSLPRTGSSMLRKCYTSDDELDELDSLLTTIILDKSVSPPTKLKEKKDSNMVRYQLLREVWRDEV